MTEHADAFPGSPDAPIIAYDTFEAANLFLAAGRTRQEVLARIGLTEPQWDRLHGIYKWFPYAGDGSGRRAYFNGLDDSEIYRRVLPPRWKVPPEDAAVLRGTWHIREAVRRNPYIGPFADCGWPATWIAAHPEASLCGYIHDGTTVYFNGRALTDRQGQALAVDAPSFEPVGGRWLRDRNHLYGQGEFGSRPTPYWYVVDGADRASFQALNLRYARDAARAYYITGKTIRTKSAEAFEVVPELRLNYRDVAREPLFDVSVIARDREVVYFYGARLKGARPEAFRDLGHGYATDGATVWYLEARQVLDGADAATFVVPGPGEPGVQGRSGQRAASDRHRPYARGVALAPAQCVEDWRAYFEARPDLHDWWWHRLARGG